MGKTIGFPTRILLILMLEHLSHSRLVIKPMNQVGWDYDTNKNFSCSSDIGSNAIIWYFTLFDTTNNVKVAVGANLTPEYVSFFQMDQTNSFNSNLIILLTSSLTAGTYTCYDGTEAASAQHTVMPPDNGTSTNLTSSSKNGDVFYYTCAASFFGNDFMIPQFDFMLHSPSLTERITNPVITKVGSKRLVRWTFVKTAECGFFKEMFVIHFSEPQGRLPIGSATNPPAIVWIVISIPPINISCVPTDVNMTIRCQIADNFVHFGDALTCSVPSSTPVSYKWTDFMYGNTSKGQQLRVWHNGTYQCNASTEQDGKIYSASKTLYDLTLRSIVSTSPLFGPIAGGTQVTFLIDGWSEQKTDIRAVYIGETLRATVVSSNREEDKLTIMTSAAGESLILKPLQIIFEFTTGPFNVTTYQYFVYRTNPEITAVQPTTFIVTGGLSITVIGRNLLFANEPLIQVTVTTLRVNPYQAKSVTSTDYCRTSSLNGTSMVCNMPPVDLPTDFLSILDWNYLNNKTSLKGNQNDSVLEIFGQNRMEKLSVSLGFFLDGYQKYMSSISESLPDIQIQFYSPPEIDQLQESHEYDPATKALLSVQGRYLARGCRLADYVVLVGDEICKNVALQDNSLSCSMPSTEPRPTENDTSVCNGNGLSVKIKIGYKEYQYSCLTYYHSKTSMIIGLSLGLSCIVILLIAIPSYIFFCRIRLANYMYFRYSFPRRLRESDPHPNRAFVGDDASQYSEISGDHQNIQAI